MQKKFKELKEGTKDELIGLMSKFDYASLPKDEIKIDLEKDLSDFSSLSEKTKNEIAALSAKADYKPGDSAEKDTLPSANPAKGIGIQEFLAAEERKMKKLMAEDEKSQAQAEREFADRNIMRKNLGMADEGIEHKFKAAEMHVSASKKEKSVQDYIVSAGTVREQIDRALEVEGREDIKSRMLSVLKLDKEKKYYK